MKVKLLKTLRAKASWKPVTEFREGNPAERWVLLLDGDLSYHSSSTELIRWILERNSWEYDAPFDWNWTGILQDYNRKVNRREFKKLK
jgi:hypothetical protein